jgi:hypothetical protein
MNDTLLAVAKRAALGEATPFTKAEFYAELDARAQAARKPGQTREQAFSEFVLKDPDGEVLFRAHRLAKGSGNCAPERVSKVARGPAPTPSLERLNALAAECRKADPKLTKEQAFTKAYTDPANRELVANERAEARAAA